MRQYEMQPMREYRIEREVQAPYPIPGAPSPLQNALQGAQPADSASGFESMWGGNWRDNLARMFELMAGGTNIQEEARTLMEAAGGFRELPFWQALQQALTSGGYAGMTPDYSFIPPPETMVRPAQQPVVPKPSIQPAGTLQPGGRVPASMMPTMPTASMQQLVQRPDINTYLTSQPTPVTPPLSWAGSPDRYRAVAYRPQMGAYGLGRRNPLEGALRRLLGGGM